MGGRRLLRPLGVALVALLAACLESPPGLGEPACGVADDIAQIALGRDHTCARLDNGGVWCWGLNEQGQLGDGSQIDRSQPSRVAGLRDVVHLAVGQDHSCALVADGSLWCWGSGSNGQLGDGRTDDAFEPVEVDLVDVADVSLGDDFSCAVTRDGAVHCWGENEHGQAGPEFTEVQPAVTRIDVDGVASSVVTGENHACALLEGGGVACWGGADFGQLGDDTLAERGVAAPVVDLEEVDKVVSGRNHVCAVKTDGSLWCWGASDRGQIGTLVDNPDDDCVNGDGVAVSCVPIPVDLGEQAIAAAAGLHHTCAVTVGGEVFCFGGNEAGQLGDSTFDDSAEPVMVRSGPTIVSVAAGETQNCATSDDHKVYCWGSNRAGQLGETAALVTPSPVKVAQTTGTTALAAGDHHTCMRSGTGVLQCWGGNDAGQLGDQTLQARSSPTDAIALSGEPDQLAPGEEHTCVVSGTARSRCWGRNSHGELGPTADDPLELSAITVSIDGDVFQMDSGDEHVCAVRADFLVFCWGDDSDGQLGNGVAGDGGPDQVAMTDILQVACGEEHTCVRQAGGGVSCWGDNDSGQLGDNSTTSRDAPPAAALDLNAEQIDAGDEFSCSLAAGVVSCWGNNEFGQLGDGSHDNRREPTVVERLPAASAIALGTEHACAMVTTGDVQAVECWGRNDGGQLGDGTTESSPIPVPVDLKGLPRAISAGARHTCALVVDEGTDETDVYCWGSDVDGRLGSGRDLYFKTATGPIDVCD